MSVVHLIFFGIIGLSSSLGHDPYGSDSDNEFANPDSEQCEIQCENNLQLPCTNDAGHKSFFGYECPSYCPCKDYEFTCEWTNSDGCKVVDCIEKIDGCDNICPMEKCNDDQIYCVDWQNGCYKGYCEDYNWETICQGGWHDVHNNDEQFFDNFETNCNGYSFGDAKVCVPKKHKHKMQMAPKPPSNEISIVLSNVQITEIADKLGQMTILMDLEVNWFDNRLKLIMEKVPTFLDNEDHKQIWSPRFRIGTDLVSHQKQMDDEFILQQYKNETSVRKISFVSATIKCEMDLHSFPFDNHECKIEVSRILKIRFVISINLPFIFQQFEDQKNETSIKNITLKSSKISHVTNNYKITNITEYKSTHSNIPTFGIHISFERDIDRINGIVITYHLMCGILVLVATINFLIDPKDTDGRGGLLVTVFLVLTTFFTVAQVDKTLS